MFSPSGALLHLLRSQQAPIIDRKPDSVLALIQKNEAQFATTHTCRQHRQATADALGRLSSDSRPAKLRNLVPYIRDALRPLSETLADEVNRLITEASSRAQQNQMHLNRSADLGQPAYQATLTSGAQTLQHAPLDYLRSKFRNTTNLCEMGFHGICKGRDHGCNGWFTEDRTLIRSHPYHPQLNLFSILMLLAEVSTYFSRVA
ncbi:MAG: hypothetical protein ABIP20_06540 [Chthoniobacteraceae bacterium]